MALICQFLLADTGNVGFELEGTITQSALRAEYSATDFGSGELGTNKIEEFNNGVNAGKVYVWAAGNNGASESGYDAAAPFYFDGTVNSVNLEGYDWTQNWLNVVSVDDFGDISSFSNHCGVTQEWCLAAPGEINSTTDLDGAFDEANGTSFAAPNAAGALAILKGAYPHLTSDQVLNILFETAEDIGDIGTDEIYGRGLIDLEAATNPNDGDWTIAAARTPSGVSFASSGLNLSAAFGDAMSKTTQSFIFVDSLNRDFTVGLDSLVTAGGVRQNAQQLLSDFNRSEFSNTVNVDGKYKVGFTLDSQDDDVNRRQISDYGDREEGENGTKALMTYSLSDVDATVGYNTNAAHALGFASVSADVDSGLYVSEAFENPYLSLADRATSVGTEYKLGNVGLKFATYNGALETQRFDFADDDDVGGYVAEANLYDAGGLSLSVQGGVTDESGTFLGSESGGALGLSDDGAQTYYTGIAASYSPMDGVRLNANYNFGVTKMDVAENSLVDNLSDVQSSSFAVGAIVDDIYSERDSFGLTVSQPLRVDSGSGSVTLPQDIALDGSIIFEESNISLAPEGREIDVEAFYDVKLAGGAELSLGSMLRFEPDHVQDADEEALLLMRYRASF